MILSKPAYYVASGFGLYGMFRLVVQYYRWRTSPLRKLPGPPMPTFLFGYFFTIFLEPFMEPHKRWWKLLQKEYGGSIPMMSYSSLLGRWSVVVLDPNIVQTILMDPSNARDPGRFPKRYDFIREIIGDGLVSLEGNAWSRHRRIIQPSFQTNVLKVALSRSVPKHMTTFLSAWRKVQGSAIDAHAHLSALTLDVICEVAFAHDSGACQALECWAERVSENSNDEPEKLDEIADPLLQAFNASLKMNIYSTLVNVLQLAWLEKYIRKDSRRTNVALNNAVDRIIQNARDKMNDEKQDGTQYKSLLQLLFNAKDSETSPSCPASRKTLSDQELRDECKTFIFAGHETTSTWCCWALYALAKHPGIQQKLYANIQEQTSTNNTITLDQIDSMSYLSAFMLEVLRLYSPIGMIMRYTSQPEIFHGFVIPKNTKLFIPIHLLHRHPDFWINPLDFIPERWLNPDTTDTAMRQKFCFLPFSAGARNCIGQRFAEMEAKLILANIVRVFIIQFAASYQDTKTTFTNVISMKGIPSLLICVKERP